MTFNEIKAILKNKCVGIAGCGGLGSNVAVALARVGVGRLVIADFDVISESNLNRQYFFFDQIGFSKAEKLHENIARINPYTLVDAHSCVLDKENIPSLFRHCDVVVEAFDGADMKQMLIEVMTEKLHHIPVVAGNGMAGWGNNETIHETQYGNLYICGDNISEVNDNNPALAPRVGIVSHMQANVVLSILLSN
ncbi:MAG: thiamine biosynthesis protein ThiF [Bacteroidetes bacterium HGW-Bacteroidetes-21]|jgi:sulfur carrier protein ThiS adenylyltransferase|nr:MAG: thiamine biosynthesis protein ThiF [Bacteroidetes bacterium HGW-Bacteroidetes-21]